MSYWLGREARGVRREREFNHGHEHEHAATIGTWPRGELQKINGTAKLSRQPAKGARMIFTNGVRPSWNKELRRDYPWIKEHWKLGKMEN